MKAAIWMISLIYSEVTVMNNIRDLIAASNSNVRAEMELNTEERIRAIYDKYPELEQLDRDIVSARTTKLIAVIDDNIVEQKHSESLEAKLLDKRNRFIARNDIDPAFDTDRVICTKCGDTGYFTNKIGIRQVCEKCRASDIEEAYRLAGLGDYSLVRTDRYSDDYFGDKRHRTKLRRKITEIATGARQDKPLWIFSDGTQTGKTFLAIYGLKLAVNFAHSAFYMHLDSLDRMYDDELDDLTDVEILVIDDYIASMTVTGNIGTRLSRLLEIRQSRDLVTIIVTSVPVADIVSESDIRISGKLRSAGVINDLGGSDT